MRVRIHWIAAGLLCCSAAQMQGTGTGVPGMLIPPVHGTVLSGSAVELPDALRGKTGVLVIGFSQGSRDQVATWGRRLEVDYRGSSTVTYYEMAELASVPRFLRGLVLKKIREDVPQGAQERFLPVFDHEADWKTATGFRSANDAYVLVVNGNGTVRWRTAGIASDTAYAEVKRQIAEARP